MHVLHLWKTGLFSGNVLLSTWQTLILFSKTLITNFYQFVLLHFCWFNPEWLWEFPCWKGGTKTCRTVFGNYWDCSCPGRPENIHWTCAFLPFKLQAHYSPWFQLKRINFFVLLIAEAVSYVQRLFIILVVIITLQSITNHQIYQRLRHQ